ncbi:MAG: hypothetical protein JW712_03955 [Dehalococcoidales bacterium]|nr:hypothetical protein [Dehalococcoidales bacterium]
MPLDLYAYTMPPWFTLYGDGTIIYLERKNSTLHEGKMNEQAVQELLDYVIGENRLFWSKQLYEYPVCDAGLDILKVAAENTTRTIRGFFGYDSKPDILSDTDWEQYLRISAVLDRLRELNPRKSKDDNFRYLGEYVPDSVRLYAMLPYEDVKKYFEEHGTQSKPWPFPEINLKNLCREPDQLKFVFCEGDMAELVQQKIPLIYGEFFTCNGTWYSVAWSPDLP